MANWTFLLLAIVQKERDHPLTPVQRVDPKMSWTFASLKP
jgi:hypothetical protein